MEGDRRLIDAVSLITIGTVFARQTEGNRLRCLGTNRVFRNCRQLPPVVLRVHRDCIEIMTMAKGD